MADQSTDRSSTTTTTTMADKVNHLQQPPPSTRPHRYIYNDSDLQHFLTSSSKDALYKFTIAMGKSCATSTTTTDTTKTESSPGSDNSRVRRYDPSQPLWGVSPGIACLHGALSVMNEEWVHQDFPPTTTNTIGNRFGNPIFRAWHTQLQQRSVRIISTILQISHELSQQKSMLHEINEDDEYDMEILVQAHEAGKNAARCNTSPNENDEKIDANFSEQDRTIVMELSCYLHDSFGHPIRLDYGTGHETSFHIFLFLLCQLRVFHNIGYSHYNTNEKDSASTPQQPHQVLPSVQRCKAIIISTYHQYLQVTRTLQTLYMLEPAGSHGVWGLDDYHCLPFYFGACQLIPEQQQHPYDDVHLPSSIHNDQILQQHGDNYLYYGCIRFIKAIKKNVPFFESSPMLNDISNIATWFKISTGLIKLYEGEVLSKRQVVQHLVFGSLFQANWMPSQTEDTMVPPADTFRTVTTAVTAVPPISETRAPWAK